MKIKAICHHYWSHRDIYGNNYWFTKVTSAKTGKSFTFDTPHSSNSNGLLFGLGLDWPSVHGTEQGLPIREFNRLKKNLVEAHNSCKDQKISDKLAELLELKPVTV